MLSVLHNYLDVVDRVLKTLENLENSEFLNSGKLKENSGNFIFTQGFVGTEFCA